MMKSYRLEAGEQMSVSFLGGVTKESVEIVEED